jgi:hypothetical protein
MIRESEPERLLNRTRLCETLEATLEYVTSVLDQQDYCLIGTAAALLHGVPLPAGDIDFLIKRRAHVDAFAAALSRFPSLTPPTLLKDGGQYYAAYNVNGVKVEASTVEWQTESRYLETMGDGPWKRQTLLAVGPYRIPTVTIELRLATELRRNRPDRYDPILLWLRNHPCDIDLLNHAMTAQGIPPERQGSILSQIIPLPRSPLTRTEASRQNGNRNLGR